MKAKSVPGAWAPKFPPGPGPGIALRPRSRRCVDLVDQLAPQGQGGGAADQMHTTATSSTEVITSRDVSERNRSTGQPTGFSTYPAPRMVWIIGSRPASIFLRR